MCWNYEIPKRKWDARDWYFQVCRVFMVLNDFRFWDEKITNFRDRNSTKENQTNYIWRWENSLEERILGDSTPQSLLDTMLYMNRLYFALCGGHEHRILWHKSSQIYLTEKPGERPNLMYVEDVSKNYPGGLKGRKIKQNCLSSCQHWEAWEVFARLYRLYNSRCPADHPDQAYYLKPLQKPKNECWYSNQPVGNNKLGTTISRMCKDAGIPGYHTNHSLRALAAVYLTVSVWLCRRTRNHGKNWAQEFRSCKKL